MDDHVPAGTHKKWDDLEPKYDLSTWRIRVENLSKWLTPKDTSILDLGAGEMYLRELIPDTVLYYPIDYKHRDSSTIVCDFNKRQFPAHHADVAFISGVLEYVEDADWFFSMLENQVKKILLTYVFCNSAKDLPYRQGKAWVNHYRIDEIIHLAGKNGFVLVQYLYNHASKSARFNFVKDIYFSS